jgi:SulP family sulfate permease
MQDPAPSGSPATGTTAPGVGLARWFPFLRWQLPTGALLQGEILAGLTVALVMIPQSVAYAALAGMPLVTGIYAALLPGLVAVLWGASPRLSVGPTALTCLLTAASLNGYAPPGSATWVALAAWLALVSGLMQLALGAWRLGWMLNLVTSPVLMGFTQAAAVLIILSQLPAMVGVAGFTPATLAAHPANLAAAVFGVASLALMGIGRRVAPRFPMVMLVLAGAALASWWIGFATRGGAVIGALPAGLPAPYWPDAAVRERIELSTLVDLLVPALVITLVSYLETASSAKIENQRENKPWNENQDLLAQGLAKMASAAVGAFPTSSSFSRSAIYLYSGARTGWATIVTMAGIWLVLGFFTPSLFHVPRAVLAALVVAAVAGLLKPGAFMALWRVSRIEAGIAGATFAITLVAAPAVYWGVLAGVLLGLAWFLYQRLHPRIIEVGLHADGSLRDRHLWKLPPLAPRLIALRMDAALDFAAAGALERHVTDELARHPEARHVCIFAQPFNWIDATGVESFGQMRRALAERGITLHLSGLKLPVETVLRRAGHLPDNPYLRLYRADTEALDALGKLDPQ